MSSQDPHDSHTTDTYGNADMSDIGAWLVICSVCYTPFYFLGLVLGGLGMMTFLYLLCITGILMMSFGNSS